jgi:hypothetical protein
MIEYISSRSYNIGDLDFRMTLYGADASFESQPGKLTKSPESVQQSIRSFIDFKGSMNQ